MKRILLYFLTIGLLSCTKTPDLKKEFQLENPYDFVIEAFDTCDVVLLGESHRIKQHQKFVSELIPKLAEHGVNNLVTEFCRYEDTPLLDSLMQMNEFDYKLAKRIMINHNWTWQYSEYFDILKSAWKVNQTRKEPFRIIGMNHSLDYSLTREDNDFWKWTEKDFARRIEKEVLSKQEKAIVYCGIHHSLTKYVQPKVDSLGNLKGFYPKNGRVGHVLYEKYKNKIVTIWIHSPLFSKNMNSCNIRPLNGKIDSIYYDLQESFAFNTHKSKLGSVVDNESYYSVGYEDFTLSKVADGYIVPCSFNEYQYSEKIPNYADSNNWLMIKKQIKSFELTENVTIDTANYWLESWYYNNKTEFENNKEKYWR
jgi:hypothetical protein